MAQEVSGRARQVGSTGTLAAAAEEAAAVGKAAEMDCPAVAGGVEAATGATGVLRAAARVEVARAAARAAEAREVAAREVVVRAMAPAHQQFCHVGRGGAWAVGTAGTAHVAGNCRGDAKRAVWAYTGFSCVSLMGGGSFGCRSF